MTQLLNGVSLLSHLGVIRVEGDDATSFLQNQLTQDFALLGLSEARLAAFCTAKGRMQASFVGFKRSHTDILLVVSRDILAPTLKRMSMFVLRAKAKLRDATAEFELYGLAGEPARPARDAERDRSGCDGRARAAAPDGSPLEAGRNCASVRGRRRA